METLTHLQTKALELFNRRDFSGLINLILSQPQVFPDKQTLGLMTSGKPGDFGYLVGLTHWGVREQNTWSNDYHWVVFTVGLSTLTLNLHGCISQSVNWVNATKNQQWVYKISVSKIAADQIVENFLTTCK